MSTELHSHEVSDNLYAEKVNGEVIFISDATSGRKGYFCLGCKKEMQAMMAHIRGRKSFFRHDPVAVKGAVKCSYKDETHRHKLAKNFLLHSKSIKVPAVYKYPPKGVEGLSYLVKEAETIFANKVELELTFYEDTDGKVLWGRPKKLSESYLLIRPDVTFFDEKNEPILLIELVATHSPNSVKLAKLKRLGINTIQVSIPKDSPEAIEACLRTTLKTKWLYNYNEERADYIRISSGHSEGISSFDEDQRRLFTETFNCRQSQIKHLIRRSQKYLETEYYRRCLRELTEEISRVEANSERTEAELAGVRDGIREKVLNGYRERRGEINERRERIEREESDFQTNRSKLESRYRNKVKELGGEQRETEQLIENLRRGAFENGESYTTRRERISKEAARVIRDVEETKSELDGYIEQEGRISEETATAEAAIVRKYEAYTRSEEDEIRRIGEQEEELPAEFARKEDLLRREFEEKEGRIAVEFERDRKELESRFEEHRKRTHSRVVSRDGQGDRWLSKRISGILGARAALNDYWEIKRTFDRIRAAHEYYKSGAYQRKPV